MPAKKKVEYDYRYSRTIKDGYEQATPEEKVSMPKTKMKKDANLILILIRKEKSAGLK